MPSDSRALAALHALTGRIASYQAALGSAADRIGAYLASASDEPLQERAAAELGEFATGRIDVSRFTALWDDSNVLDDFERRLLQRAHEVLREQASMPHTQFLIDVPSGGRLTGALGHAFAELGCAFGAILVSELVRSGRYDERDHSAMLHGLPRHHWNRTERSTSPPLVVTVDGADLWAGEIAQYLDGNQKIILVVRPPTPPAPLVRLITPGTLVMQTTVVEALATAMQAEGPAIAALVPEGGDAAEFVHVPPHPPTPDAHTPPHTRITVSVTPPAARKTLPSWTAWQQQQELLQLLALSTPPAISAAANADNGGGVVADPADRLAAWLLSRAAPITSHDSPVTKP